MSPELVGILFAGVAGIIGAMSTFSSNRSKQASADVKSLRARVRRLERRDLANTHHMFVLEREIVKLGGDIPPRPPIIDEPLTEDPDE